MRASRYAILAFFLSAVAFAPETWAQGAGSKMQRTALWIRNDAHQNEGKEVVLDCAFVEPLDSGSPRAAALRGQGLGLFYAADETGNFLPIMVISADANSFMKKFGTRKTYYDERKRTRPLRGIVAAAKGKFFSRTRVSMGETAVTHYLRYGGAKEWLAPQETGATSMSQVSAPLKKVAFDEKPMTSFSYDGKRLAEARVIDVSRDGVVLTDKDAVSVIVPLEKAVKMPELRMRAKEAMEAALATE
jgi:hypothetical protein